MPEEAPPRGLLLQWHVTNACDQRCRHCYDEGAPSTAEIPLEGLLELLHRYLDFLHASGMKGSINFTGGEPLLRADLPDLLTEVHRHGDTLSYAVLSNGSLIDRALSRQLRRTGCRFVQISVDGDPETHDALRGPGSFDACRRALRVLRRQGVTTMVSFTVSRANRETFEEVVRMARVEGVAVVWSDRLIPLGRGKELGEDPLSPREVDGFFESMFRAASDLRRRRFCRTRVRMHRALQFRTLLDHGVKDVVPYRCNAGRGLLALTPEGNILPCRRMPVPVGSLATDSLEEVYREAPFLRALRSAGRVAVGCEGCTWNASCAGGLRCLAFACTGDPFQADPQCSLAREAGSVMAASAADSASTNGSRRRG